MTTTTKSANTTTRTTTTTTTCTTRSTLFLEYFKYTYSTLLLLFSIVLVMGCIFTGKSKGSVEFNIHPILSCILFWLLISWLAIMEGGQGCLVGLKPIPKKKYILSHPRSYKSCKVAHQGDNLERFIIGRQFLVVLVIFLINIMGEYSMKQEEAQQAQQEEEATTATTYPYPYAKIPNWINMIFLDNSIALMITTIDMGQLPAQVNAAVAMLDFINNYTMIVTTYISLGIEFSGLLHCVYLVQYGFAYFITKTKTKTSDNSNEEIEISESESESESSRNNTITKKIFFWLRVLISLCVLCFALAVTVTALLEGKSGMWNGVSPALSIIIFFCLLCLVGLMEGLQIAAFALLNTPNNELLEYKIAHKNCALMYEGQNLQSFLVGRQIFVAALMFIVARIATISIDANSGQTNIFNVSNGFQYFLDTGLLGAVILTIIGSLAWRVIASSFPLLFMSNPIIYVIIRACFILESTGVCSAAWLIALICKKIFRIKSDDAYLNNNENNTNEIEIENDTDDTERGGLADEDAAAAIAGDTPTIKVDSLRSAFASQRQRHRMSSSSSSGAGSSNNRSVVFSSRELRFNDDDDNMKAKMDKMKSSFVASARLSAVMSTKDLGSLMEELGNEYGVDSYDEDDEGDGDDEKDDKKSNNNVGLVELSEGEEGIDPEHEC